MVELRAYQPLWHLCGIATFPVYLVRRRVDSLQWVPARECHSIQSVVLRRALAERRQRADPRTRHLVATYRVNPFLEASVVAEIESLRDASPGLWQVYGLGRRCRRGSGVRGFRGGAPPTRDGRAPLGRGRTVWSCRSRSATTD